MTSLWNGKVLCLLLILKFFDIMEIFYRSGRVRMSTLRIRGCPFICRQIKLTSTQKVTSRFLRFIHIWIKQGVEKIVLKRNFEFEKKCRLKSVIQNKYFNSKCYKPIFSNTAYLDRSYSSSQRYEAFFF